MTQRIRKTIFALAIFFLSPLIAQSVYASVVINEILPKTTDVTNEWIELYNTGSDPVNLNTWTLQNTQGTPKTFIIPASGIIQSHGFLLFGETQTGIQFNPNGDTVKLSDANNVTVDTESFDGTLGFNTSMGRIPDGAANWVVCNTPATPNAANNCPIPSPTPTPTVTNTPTPTTSDTPYIPPAPPSDNATPTSLPPVLGAMYTPSPTPTPTMSPDDLVNVEIPKTIHITKTIAIETIIVLGVWILLAIVAIANRNSNRRRKQKPLSPPTTGIS